MIISGDRNLPRRHGEQPRRYARPQSAFICVNLRQNVLALIRINSRQNRLTKAISSGCCPDKLPGEIPQSSHHWQSSQHCDRRRPLLGSWCTGCGVLQSFCGYKAIAADVLHIAELLKTEPVREGRMWSSPDTMASERPTIVRFSHRAGYARTATFRCVFQRRSAFPHAQESATRGGTRA